MSVCGCLCARRSVPPPPGAAARRRGARGGDRLGQTHQCFTTVWRQEGKKWRDKNIAGRISRQNGRLLNNCTKSPLLSVLKIAEKARQSSINDFRKLVGELTHAVRNLYFWL